MALAPAACSPPCWRPRLASSIAAVVVSRFSRPIAGSAYLLATTSPCSVMRMRPATVPAGWARIASKLEPPPRPTAPPRPWKNCSATPASATTPFSSRCASCSDQIEVRYEPSLFESE